MHRWLINQTPRPQKLLIVWHPRPHAHADTLPEAGKRRQLLSWFAVFLGGGGVLVGKPQERPINNSQVGWSGVINTASHCWLAEPRKSWWQQLDRGFRKDSWEREGDCGEHPPLSAPWDSNLLPPNQEFTSSCVFVSERQGRDLIILSKGGRNLHLNVWYGDWVTGESCHFSLIWD